MNGVELIVKERQRQIVEEGKTAALDDKHKNAELTMAAICYAYIGCGGTRMDQEDVAIYWPWETELWKPKDRIRNLVRAGALIAAEIDRLQRLEGKAGE